MKISIVTILLLFIVNSVVGQNNNVGINTSTPHPSAVLHLESSNQGLLVPRLTITQRDAITAPATGLIIYNSDDNQEEIYNGTCWIPSYLKNCSDCFSDISFSQANYIIDRVTNMAITIPVTINQVSSGVPLPMEFAVTHTFSPETRVTLSQYNLTGSGTINISIQTSVFETGGDYYISFLSTCGSFTTTKTVRVTINPCQQVLISSNQSNFNLVSQGVTGNTCVVVTINEGVTVRSSSSTLPAFTTIGVNTACNMGIVNKGAIFGKGGNSPVASAQNGQDGGIAMQLTSPTTIRNTGMIYGGGGSGMTTAIFQNINLGPFSICLAVGAGGGGGMPSGLGADLSPGSCTVSFGSTEDGMNAGINYDDNEGAGVSKSYNQPVNIAVVSGEIVITANSGGGGDFGEVGQIPTQPIDFTGTNLQICVNIPFLGNVCAPVPGFGALLNTISTNVNAQFSSSAAGQGGMAIKHGAPVSISDGNNQSYSIRGAVGN